MSLRVGERVEVDELIVIGELVGFDGAIGVVGGKMGDGDATPMAVSLMTA